MISDNSHTPLSPRTIPWPWRLLVALLLGVAAALLLQVIAVPPLWRALLVALLVIGAIAADIAFRARYTGGGPQRGYLQIVLPLLALLVVGTLLTVASPVQPVLGIVVAALLGVVAFGVLHFGQRNQMRHAKRSADTHDAADSTHTAIAERGGDHHPGRDDLPDRSRGHRT